MKHIGDDTFQTEVAKGLVLVDFFAEWCGPCKMQAPILDALATEFKGKVTFAKIDVDEAPKTSNTFQITSVPTVILFKDGKEISRFIGLKDKETMKKSISQFI
jgi:thioredoxin 1